MVGRDLIRTAAEPRMELRISLMTRIHKMPKTKLRMTKEWPAFAPLRRGNRSQERCSVRCLQRICAMKATRSPVVRWG